MQRDIRSSLHYQEAESLYRRIRQPGSGQISDAAEIHISPDKTEVAFAGALLDTLEGIPPTRICRTQLGSGDTEICSFGPHSDRMPKYSPDGRYIAFLSDRDKLSGFQLYLLDLASGAVRSTPAVEGWVEYLHWSHDGNSILLGVCGHGAEVSSVQGAVGSERIAEERPAWMPSVDAGDDSHQWRRAWIYDFAADQVRLVSPQNLNIWEAVWCGSEKFAALVSPGAREGLWYRASLHVCELMTGNSTEIYVPEDQLGWPSASPTGAYLAVVEGICSDRGMVAGDLRLIDVASGTARCIDTRGIDITYTEWRSDRQLLLAGYRGFDMLVTLYDCVSETFTEVWSSREVTAGWPYVTVVGVNETGDCVLIGENFLRAPEIALVRDGQYRVVKSFDLGYSEEARAVRTVERISWEAPDGLEIQGWVLLPEGSTPHPLVMVIHGGPVWHWRPAWLGRDAASIMMLVMLMLVKRGYMLFFPNPRGSSGRGQDFARKVLGDVNGADGRDLLSGVDALVARDIVDTRRIGVTGISYGGNMTCWLVTQDQRFAAAVAISPHSDQVSQCLMSNIPEFNEIFIGERYHDPNGKNYERSAIMHAHKASTPTLNIAGALDRCTPPNQAVEFHNALLGAGTQSVLVTYPHEGHGIRQLPAVIDCAARVVAWFEEYMSAAREANSASGS